MAPPQKGQIHPSRYLIALGAIFVVLFGVVLGFGSGSFGERLKPRLGLDLVGGTTLTLTARTPDGKPPSKENLELARSIIEQRVNGSGVAEAEVVTEGNDRIVINAPGQNGDAILKLGAPAQLRFRKLINVVNDSPAAATPAPNPSSSASPSGSPKPSATGSAEPSATASASPSKTAAATPSASGAATPGASGTPNPSTSPVKSTAELQATILKKLGSAASVAAQITDPTTVTSNAATMAALEPFRTLTPEEVAALPVQIQFNVPQVTCAQLNKRPIGSIIDPKQQAVACEPDSNQKMLLDVAKVEGSDIDSAKAALGTGSTAGWQVDLTFGGAGVEKWTALTREAVDNTATPKCEQAALAQGPATNPTVCRVAIVLDNSVVSAPSIQTVLSTTSTISGGFNRDSANLLANQLKYGALPLSFDPGEKSSISATLGTDYLKAGLLAAGVGMILVIAYAFFYYRLLGLVITLSLLLSALLTFGMLIFLGRQIGFTLTLAGIAGFIVSLGVAADSFVIYFERLKDEIRDGRSPRSAVPRAWLRARRTIITANMVTFLAALTLWLVGIGSVQGFAFALGLATMLDLLIVFLFRHPMMTLLARTPAFLSPRVSGLGRVLHHASEDTPTTGSRTARPKEA